MPRSSLCGRFILLSFLHQSVAPSDQRRSYFRNIATVLSGAVAAQSIPLLAMLLITRLITPQALGLFSVWFGVVILLSILATASLDVLLVTVKDEGDRAVCLRTAELLCMAVAMATALAALLLEGWLHTRLQGWRWDTSVALGLAIWVSGMNDLWSSAAVSRGNFAMVNKIRIVSAAGVALVQIGLSIAGLDSTALIWGYVVGTAGGTLLGRWVLAGSFSAPGGTVTSRDIRRFLRLHYRTPAYSLPARLLNTTAQQLPVLASGAIFGPEPAGFLALAIRTLVAPVTIFSTSVQDVYRNRATNDYHARGNCRAAYLDSLKLLVTVGLIPSAVVLVAGPYLFALVYGAPWREAGVIAQYLAPLLFFRFFASPLGYTLLITDRAHQEFYWQVALASMTLIVFLLPASMLTVVAAYSAGYSLLYVVYAWLSYRASLGHAAGAASATGASHVR